MPTVDDGAGPGPAAGHARGDDRGARRRSSSGRPATSATSSTPTGRSSASWPVDAAGGRGAPAGRRGPAGGVAPPRASARQLDPVDLDAATRLASLRPADVGVAGGLAGGQRHRRERLRRRAPKPAGWAAVFGFYTPSLRTTELIPEQVRLLRSLLVGREPQVDRVVLASGTDGTYTPRASPSLSRSRPSRSRARRHEVARAVAVG